MIIISVDMESDEFIALGDTVQIAIAALKARWLKHCENSPHSDKDMPDKLIESGDARIMQVEPGSCVIYGRDSSGQITYR